MPESIQVVFLFSGCKCIKKCFTTHFLARKGLRKGLHKPAQIQSVVQVKKIRNLCNGNNNLKQEK